MASSVLVAAVVSGIVVARKPSALAPASAPLPSAVARTPRAPAERKIANLAAYIPAQCYAETRPDAPGEDGRPHNPCFTCHRDSVAPNYVNDADTQESLSFARFATENRWRHVFASPAPVAMADDALLAWVRTSNYEPLSTALAKPSATWDLNGNGRWDGFTPDCAFRFDQQGFDRRDDGKATGWRAFAYAPMPGMFWPTNGSAGDAMIRLPEAFRNDSDGNASDSIYALNLAILEAYVRRVDVPIPRTDEKALGSDLDGDGRLGSATRVAFVWPPKAGRPFHYVGQAAALDPKVEGWPAAGLFPRGTEFLHSLRYLDVDDGKTRMAARMKELRYMRKTRWLTYSDLELAAEVEAREKRKSPDRLRWVMGDAETGVLTGTGWSLQAFIEDPSGALRPQSFEETAACIGCHGGTGATTDSIFAFARKLDTSTYREGWYHWGERGLAAIAEPKRADGSGEYAHWLEATGGGDDFRTNDEVRARFFRADGHLDTGRSKAFAHDIAALLVPSPSRALMLDRAYLGLVKEQRFDLGRDVLVGAPPHARQRAAQDEATGIPKAI